MTGAGRRGRARRAPARRSTVGAVEPGRRAGGDAAAGPGRRRAESPRRAALSPFTQPRPRGGRRDQARPRRARRGADRRPGRASARSSAAARSPPRGPRSRPRGSCARGPTPRRASCATRSSAPPTPTRGCRPAAPAPAALRRPAERAAVTARHHARARAATRARGSPAVRRAIVLANRRRRAADARRWPSLADRGTTRDASPARRSRSRPRGRREAEIDVAAAGADGLAAGRLVARAAGGSVVLAHPFAVAPAPPEPPPLGPLSAPARRRPRDRRALRARARSSAATRSGRHRASRSTERLDADASCERQRALVRAPHAARRRPRAAARPSTPTRCPPATLRELGAARYAFRAVARSPARRRARGRRLGAVRAMRTVDALRPARLPPVRRRPRRAAAGPRRSRPFALEEVDIERDDALLRALPRADPGRSRSTARSCSSSSSTRRRWPRGSRVIAR